MELATENARLKEDAESHEKEQQEALDKVFKAEKALTTCENTDEKLQQRIDTYLRQEKTISEATTNGTAFTDVELRADSWNNGSHYGLKRIVDAILARSASADRAEDQVEELRESERKLKERIAVLEPESETTY